MTGHDADGCALGGSAMTAANSKHNQISTASRMNSPESIAISWYQACFQTLFYWPIPGTARVTGARGIYLAIFME